MLVGILVVNSRGQLAITETMPSAANTFNGSSAVQQSDYWELANFGTNDIDMTGYAFSDKDAGFAGKDATPFNGLTVHPGEVILFVQDNVNTTATSVQQWWGSNLSTNVRIFFFSGHGQSSGGDGIFLWNPAGELIGKAEYGSATRGRSFTYDPATGDFGLLSTNGVNGGFQATTRDDQGSPGATIGAVALVITKNPTNLTVPVGQTATLSVNGRGLPNPRFQWQHDGTDISGAISTNLVITNAQAADAGTYSAIVYNGLETLFSSNAVVTVSGLPFTPIIVQPPVSLWAYVGQNPSLSVQAIGNPSPSYQWKFNGNILGGETGSQLVLASVATNQTGAYSVTVSNSAGGTNLFATLTVTPKPNLVITEVSSSQATNASGGSLGHNDWWELSNLDTFAVNLRGFRFDDSSVSLATSVTFTNNIMIQPGESVVFVEGMTESEFRAWWGTQLSSDAKIISYSGPGLSFSSAGDAVGLWNAAATDDSDRVTTALFATATTGVTFGFDPGAKTFGESSVANVHGAFRAASLGDVGSPGTIFNPPNIAGVIETSGGYDLTLLTDSNFNYTVFFKTNLASANWMTLTNLTAVGNATTIRDATGEHIRFYRAMVQR